MFPGQGCAHSRTLSRELVHGSKAELWAVQAGQPQEPAWEQLSCRHSGPVPSFGFLSCGEGSGESEGRAEALLPRLPREQCLYQQGTLMMTLACNPFPVYRALGLIFNMRKWSPGYSASLSLFPLLYK